MGSVSDIKLYIFNASAFAVSLADIDVVLKLTLLAVSIGYTIQKWYYLNKNEKDE
jgi:hypothetical protein